MNEVQLSTANPALMWEDSKQLQEVRKLFAPNLSDTEFQIFVGMGKATGLNPFTREMWAVKYDKNAAAQIFIGRDGYRKAAQAHSEYDYHQADAVYQNDKFEVVNGEVKHSYNLADRGRLVGAYCIAKRHKSSRPIYVFAEISEYSTGRSVWKDKPATMIKKVAESQCLRACFQDLLGGTYAEEEMDRANQKASADDDQIADLKKNLKKEPIDITPTLATVQQISDIHKFMAIKGFHGERLDKAMQHYNVHVIEELTTDQAQDFINKLNKIDKNGEKHG